jgi:DNA-binding MarR family transcriptional regulator
MTRETASRPEDFGVLLNLAFGVFKKKLHLAMADAGFDDLGPAFGYVFRMLAGGEANLSDLARALEITAPGALKIVNDMAAKGYVERVDHPTDARQRLLRLTPRAREAMKFARRFHARFEAGLERQLGATAARALRRSLEAIVDSGTEAGHGPSVRLRPI